MRGHVVREVRDTGTELPQPLVDVRPEVGRAGASHLAPYAYHEGLVPFGVGRPTPLAFVELAAPCQKPVRVFPRVASCFARLVEYLATLGSACTGVGSTLFAYVLSALDFLDMLHML